MTEVYNSLHLFSHRITCYKLQTRTQSSVVSVVGISSPLALCLPIPLQPPLETLTSMDLEIDAFIHGFSIIMDAISFIKSSYVLTLEPSG